MPSAFGNLLTALLEDRQWTVPQFAQKVSVHRSFIGFIVRGERRPPLDAVEHWALILGLTGTRRDEFIFAAALEHTPDIVRKKLDDLQELVRRRR